MDQLGTHSWVAFLFWALLAGVLMGVKVLLEAAGNLLLIVYNGQVLVQEEQACAVHATNVTDA